MRGVHVLAAALYAGIGLWAYRTVLPAPAATVPVPVFLRGEFLALVHDDQQMVIALAAHNAHALVTSPGTLLEGGQCYPLSRSFALGEHEFVEGLLGALPYATTRDPLLMYNVVLVLVVWLAAVAMYALVYDATRSPGAAFVAGFLFAFCPTRLLDPAHPMVQADQWTPLALLFAHRLFTRPSWAAAGALALFTTLQALDGVYQTLAFAVLGAAFGVWLLAGNVRRLPAILPKLAGAVAATAAAVTLCYAPYLHMKQVWGTLGGHDSLLLSVDEFAFGSSNYLGTVTLVLAAIGVLDRLRGPRRTWGGDPRLAFLVGGLLIFWLVVLAIPIPGTQVRIPSLFTLLRPYVPGLDAVRGAVAARLGMVLAAAFLAGYGVLALAPLHRLGGMLLAGAIVVAGFIEVFHPPTAQWTFGRTTEVAAYRVRPPDRVIALYRTLPAGAVLDLPLAWGTWGVLNQMAHYDLLSAYHHHPVAACYNSFGSPLQADMQALAQQVPSPDALSELYALGFRAVVVHGEFGVTRSLMARIRVAAPGAGSLAVLWQADAHAAFAIANTVPVDVSFAPLASGVDSLDAVDVAPPSASVPMPFRNPGPATYRHPDPIEPTALVARWLDAHGAPIAEYPVAALLPLALAPGRSMVRSVRMPVPDVDGDVQVTLAQATAPDRVLSRRAVHVHR